MILCLAFASGCREKELISVPIFISRFNKISDERVDKKNICALEDGDNLVYNFLLGENILLTLKSQKESGRIFQCTVTAQREKALDEKKFFDICADVIRSYEKVDKDHTENILRSFSFKKGEASAKDGFYRIDFLANEAAVFFSVESSRLNSEKVTDNKLYE